ncbi:MAG: CorA family divalent cation transporter, partial [Chloroflexota bacterium]
TNQIMKILTIVSTMLLPTSVIVGFFGTNNLQTIPLLVHPAGFVIMVLIIISLSGGALVYFFRQGWLP